MHHCQKVKKFYISWFNLNESKYFTLSKATQTEKLHIILTALVFSAVPKVGLYSIYNINSSFMPVGKVTDVKLTALVTSIS